MNLAPQLTFPGRCREAFQFYAELFGGEVTVINTFGGNEDRKLPPGSVPAPPEYVRFAEIKFGQNVLRGNDLNEEQFVPMIGFSISLHLNDADEAKRIFDSLSLGGNTTSPLGEVDWAKLFGQVTDRFGVPWLILALDG
ncbi:VOC family protein [Mesorhizobium sp. 1M-11]|uniref:VOC family protein n=1 Tax=Mesorhizobium sp. 1M-11 TaxID=1529006 RepID=UPI0006C7728E|nr:VOC family protein [Mesorhizobium sp. 1M-11]